MVNNNVLCIGAQYVKSISKMGKNVKGNKATEKFVKEKLEDLAFRIQD
jgi:hypothetical protein